MNNENLQKLVDKAGEMALHNIWGENAYKINMAILKIDNNNCSAYTRLGKYHKLNANIVEAKNMYLKALGIDPNNRGALNNLSDFEKDQKENDAVEKLHTINELMKEGQSSMIKGKYKLSVKLFYKANNIEPLLAHAICLANAYKKVGKFDYIERLYNQLIEDSHIQADIDTINNEFRMLRIKRKVIAE